MPCDDGVVWQLHQLHSQNSALQPLIERSLGSAEAYSIIRSRGEFLRVASDLNIRVPVTRNVDSEADVRAAWAEVPAVLKLDGTWGGAGVAIAQSLSDALAAFRKLALPINVGVAWKRWLINQDPIALWTWHRSKRSSVTMQEFIAGRPANTMMACWQGEVLALVSVEVLSSQGPTGAATVVQIVQNDEIEQAARKLARELNLSGFHGLDFILEEDSEAAYLIELNPRCTQLGHLRLWSQGDLAGQVCARLWNQLPEVPALEDCIQGNTIAFFPQALMWNPKSRYLRNGYHDVPWEEPALVRELLRAAWPERRLLSRIYHHYRAPKRQQEVSFERPKKVATLQGP